MALGEAGNPFGITTAVMFEQALARHREGRAAEAAIIYEKVLAGDPRHFDSLHMLGVIALQAGDAERARQLIGGAIAVNPDFASAHSNLAAVLRSLGRFDEALQAYDRAVRLEPDHISAHHDRGDVLLMLGRPAEAVASFDEALARQPEHLDATLGRAIGRDRLEAPVAATAWVDPVDALHRDYAVAFYNHGNAMRNAQRFEEALACYERSIERAPNFVDALNNRAFTLADLQRLDEAVAGYDDAIALDPDSARLHNNRANALWKLGRTDEALVGFARAIALDGDYAEAHNNLGHALLSLKRPAEALACFERVMAADPDHPFLLGSLVHAQLKAAEWAGLDTRIEALRGAILADRKTTSPFIPATTLDDPDIQSRASRKFAETFYPSQPLIPAGDRAPAARKLRIGYYSSDYYLHATAWLIAGLFDQHDSDRFEIFAFSFGRDAGDAMRRRIASSAAHFIDIADQSDEVVARISRQLGIDIAVDLKGYTDGARPGIFAARCAPVQVNYLGFPGTMGSTHYDYILADSTIVPREHWRYYAEQVAYLPDSYQVTDSTRPISDRLFTRAELGLPHRGFVFCCFNTVSKILPAIFDRWMRMLRTVEGSVLWLYGESPVAVENLRREAQARGVDSARLVFAPHMPQADHLARHRLADLFVDSWPYNAHTTASDALWAGLPVLTRLGRSFPSRVAASLLKAAGLPELIAASEDEYERRAIELATDPEQLAAIRGKLAAQRLSCALFDTRRFTRNIEAIYSAMHDRQRAGLWPAPLVLPG